MASNEELMELLESAIGQLRKIDQQNDSVNRAKSDPDACVCGHPRKNHLFGSGNCLCRTEHGASWRYCRCVGFGVGVLPPRWPCNCHFEEDIRDTRMPGSKVLTDYAMHEIALIRAARNLEE